MVFSFFTSSADLTKESPIHSIFCSKRKLRSSLSFFVKQGNEISVFGRFTPLFDCNRPPKTTFSFTLFFPLLFSTNKDNFPSVRVVLLKEFNQKGFVFYTNLNSQKGNELKENPKAAMCFHWKSLLRQIRVSGTVIKVTDEVADQYYNSRGYESRIGAWASKQSKELDSRSELINLIREFKQKYNDVNKVPRPSHWSGWNLSPSSIEFWLDGDSRIHERLKYTKDKNSKWIKSLLSP